MATLTAWAFATVDGAEQAVEHLKQLQSQQLIKLQDAAVVTGPVYKKKPKTKQLNNLTGAGALAGSMSDVGIDDNFINSVKQRVTPGTSALFLLSSDAVTDRVKGTFTGLNPELIATTCPPTKRPSSARSSPKTDDLSSRSRFG